MIRLRASNLDAWVRFIEPERPEFEVSAEDFIAQLRGEMEPNDAMLSGTAFHSLLERLRVGAVVANDGLEVDGFRFFFDADYDLAIPAVREVQAPERLFLTPSGPVVLTGRPDARDGFTVTDYKLTGRFDAERYGDSLQWRTYLLLAGCRRFRYVAFECKRKERDVFIHSVHELDFWRYEGMEADVERRVAELAEFVAAHVPEMVTEEPILKEAVA